MSGRRAKALRRYVLATPKPLQHRTAWTDIKGVRHAADQDARYRRMKKRYCRHREIEESQP